MSYTEIISGRVVLDVLNNIRNRHSRRLFAWWDAMFGRISLLLIPLISGEEWIPCLVMTECSSNAVILGHRSIRKVLKRWRKYLGIVPKL
jgi:hypothetical protein